MKRATIAAFAAALTFSMSILARASEVRPVQTLVSDWVHGIHKTLKWEAADQLQGVSIQVDAAAVSTPADFGRALSELNQIIAAPPVKAIPLQACIFDDVVVIRRVDQPECGVPLPISE